MKFLSGLLLFTLVQCCYSYCDVNCSSSYCNDVTFTNYYIMTISVPEGVSTIHTGIVNANDPVKLEVMTPDNYRRWQTQSYNYISQFSIHYTKCNRTATTITQSMVGTETLYAVFKCSNFIVNCNANIYAYSSQDDIKLQEFLSPAILIGSFFCFMIIIIVTICVTQMIKQCYLKDKCCFSTTGSCHRSKLCCCCESKIYYVDDNIIIEDDNL